MSTKQQKTRGEKLLGAGQQQRQQQQRQAWAQWQQQLEEQRQQNTHAAEEDKPELSRKGKRRSIELTPVNTLEAGGRVLAKAPKKQKKGKFVSCCCFVVCALKVCLGESLETLLLRTPDEIRTKIVFHLRHDTQRLMLLKFTSVFRHLIKLSRPMPVFRSRDGRDITAKYVEWMGWFCKPTIRHLYPKTAYYNGAFLWCNEVLYVGEEEANTVRLIRESMADDRSVRRALSFD